jgi:hypothetical protein
MTLDDDLGYGKTTVASFEHVELPASHTLKT